MSTDELHPAYRPDTTRYHFGYLLTSMAGWLKTASVNLRPDSPDIQVVQDIRSRVLDQLDPAPRSGFVLSWALEQIESDLLNVLCRTRGRWATNALARAYGLLYEARSCLQQPPRYHHTVWVSGRYTSSPYALTPIPPQERRETTSPASSSS